MRLPSSKSNLKNSLAPHALLLVTAAFSLSSCRLQLIGSSTLSPVAPGASRYAASEFRGITGVVAYGDAPGAPTGTPSARQATIYWQPFASSSASTTYVLLRVSMGGSFSGTVASSCLSSTTTPCQACEVTGAGVQACTDSEIGAAPAKYDYVVALKSGSSLVLPPESDSGYRIRVPVPPSNMVLVSRSAVNYEICSQMGKTTDPLSFNRCAYSGLGAVPPRSKPGGTLLGLPATHYDFGYDLFVDRWVMGCRWTSLADGGMCGAGATAGNCYGSAAPAGTVGVVGNVFYTTSTARCYVRQAGGWTELNSSALAAGERALAVTNDASLNGGRIPPLVRIEQARAFDSCQTMDAGSGYGVKRLPRGREWIAMNASPTSGEAGYLTDIQIEALENGTNHPINQACNTNTHDGIVADASNTFPTGEIAGDTGGAVSSVVLGSEHTANCRSRYGHQDYVGNILQWTSDYLTSCDASFNCYGATSPWDDGNTVLDGFIFGPAGRGPAPNNWFVMNWDGSATGSDPSPFPTHFALPVGIPLNDNDGGNGLALWADYAASRFRGDSTTLNNWPSAAHGVYAGGYWGDAGSTGRWKQLWHPQSTTSSSVVGARCVVSAE